MKHIVLHICDMESAAVRRPDSDAEQPARSHSVTMECEPAMLKDEPEWGECAVSAAAAAEGLYTGHEIKEELVIGPELVHRQDNELSMQHELTKEETPCEPKPTDGDNAAPKSSRSCPEVEPRYNTSVMETRQKLYICNSCKKQFITKAHLTNHVQIHKGEKLYSCEKCHEQFPNVSALTCHVLAHNVNINCCVVDYLLDGSSHFSKLSLKNKMYIVQQGPARPELKIDYKRKDGYVRRRFHAELYTKYNWLTGSCKLNRMFCFPCLLFSDEPNVWTKTGLCDTNNFTNLARSHTQSENHIRSCISLHEFSCNRIENYADNHFEDNRKVDRNRNLMKRFIDAVVFLGKQELAFRGHNERPDSDKCANYVESLLYLSKYDSILESHLEQCASTSNPVFSGLSSAVQYNLANCVAAVISDEIKGEIDRAKFVSLIIDETPDANREQLSVIFRYLSETGLEERFIGVLDVSNSCTGEALSKELLDILDQYRCKGKLIGQSYGGANGMYCEVQGLVRRECTLAHVVPCYAHILNSVLCRSFEHVPEVKTFFGHINGLVRFFNKSSKRSNLLKDISDRRLPGAAETWWHYDSRIINVIFNSKLDMVKAFNTMLNSPQSWDSESLALADSYLSKLEDMEFSFIFHVLSEILSRTDILFASLQSEQVEVAVRQVRSFLSWLSDMFMNEFDSIFASVQEFCEPPRRRRRLYPDVDLKTQYKLVFEKIITHVTIQIKLRYYTFNKLTFLDLINKTKYTHYCRSFPDDKISDLKKEFPGLFDIKALRNELQVMYTISTLNTLDPYELYLYLHNSPLSDTFPQLITLCRIFWTLPVSAAFVERSLSLSTLKRIHTYARNCRKEERLSNLAIISIEKDLLLKVQKRSQFYDNVLAHFVKKDSTIILEYNKGLYID